MPRRPRFDHPGALHHVMLRGVDRQPIFSDDLDRTRLVDRLERVLPEEHVECLAWCLMPNHAHFLLRTGDRPLWRAMHRVETGYAGTFNRRHGRVGHLFQDRYRALPVTDDAYLLMAVRYVHRNPVEGGLVRSVEALEEYRWGGHAVLMGRAAAAFQSVEAVLGWLGNTPVEARARLRDWMDAEGDAWPDLEAPPPAPARPDPGASRSGPEGIADLPTLLRWACSRLGADATAVRAGRRRRTDADARALGCHAAWRAGFVHGEIARVFGVSRQAVAGCIDRGRALARELDLGQEFLAFLHPDP